MTQRLGSVFKWIGLGVLGAALAALFMIAGVLIALSQGWLDEALIARATAATGREVAIDGGITAELALTPQITITDLSIANAPWDEARSGKLLEAERLSFRIELLELLRGRLVFPSVRLGGAALTLTRGEDGTGNWDLMPSAEPAAEDERPYIPVIRDLNIDDSSVDFTDLEREIEGTLALASVEAESSAGRRVRADGHGHYAGQAFELMVSAGPLAELRAAGKPYPLTVALRVGETRFEAEGHARWPFALEGIEFELALSGTDLAELYPITGIPLPPSGPYNIKGHLLRERDVWSFTDFAGRVGDSDVDGDVTLDVGRTPPLMTAELRSGRLALADLGGFIGAPPDAETPTRAPDKIIPDMGIKLDRLRAFDMDVEFESKEVIAHRLPISELAVHLTLRGGRLALEPLEFGVAGGTINGPVVLDGREDVPVVDVNLNLARIELAPFLRAYEMADLTQGSLAATLELHGRGYSLAEVLAAADGHLRAVMSGGTVDPLLVELIGLDIAEALAVVITDDDPIAVHCAVGNMRADAGQLHIEGMVIDTADSNIWISGSVDLREERLALRVEADPKDPSLLSANAPIAISGLFKHPQVAVDPLSTEDEGGIVEVVGDVLNPALALLPFVDLGLAEDTDCEPAGGADAGGDAGGTGSTADEAAVARAAGFD